MENNGAPPTGSREELFHQVDEAAAVMLHLLEGLNTKQLNAVPFDDSWTAAQLAIHVSKSNNGIVHAMEMPGKLPERAPTQRVEELRKVFLNFEHKMKSPDFIVPAAGFYEKEKIVESLALSSSRLQEKSALVNLEEVITFSAFGEITRLELLYFVLYHTMRHTYQLQHIIAALKENENSIRQ